MTKQQQNELDLYYDEINKALICDAKVKKNFMLDLKENIKDFIEENPGASVDDVIARFGSPAIISETFFENLNPKHVKKEINGKRVLVIGVAIAITLLLLYLAISFIDVHLNATGYLVEHSASQVAIETITN